MTVGSRSPER